MVIHIELEYKSAIVQPDGTIGFDFENRRKSNEKLIWNVFYYNPNSKRIEEINIFYGRFLQDVNFILKNCSTREEFDSELKSELQYYYWCRSEHEVLIKPWIGDDSVERKIDIYTQVLLNWQQFSDYVWSFKKQEETI